MASKILVICCNWNGWSCLEAAASSGLHYPASVRVMRVTCLSRIHAGLILKAFELKADGAMLAGCEPGSCQFGNGVECVTREYEKAQGLLEMLGINKDRLALVQLPAFDGRRFVAQITAFIHNIEKMPRPARRKSRLQGGLNQVMKEGR